MSRVWVFDEDYYQRINECRKDFLNELLPSLITDHELRTALDAGCGIGFFSHYLAGLALQVTAFDARVENIAEAKQRFPELNFHVHDIENPLVQELGSFDLVLCFGLLYHLENPIRAVRNLHVLTRGIIVIESMVLPHQLPLAAVMDERYSEDQSVNYISFVPSEACIIKLLYNAGFVAVYKPQRLPRHTDFQTSLAYRRQRTVLVAAKTELASPTLRRLPEPRMVNIWQRGWGFQAERVLRVLRKFMRARP